MSAIFRPHVNFVSFCLVVSSPILWLTTVGHACCLDAECDDGNECTADYCVGAQWGDGVCWLPGHCVHATFPRPCSDDGDECTADYCVDGVCMHEGCTSAQCCDDGNDCTWDYCHREYSDGSIVYSECRYGPLTETPCSDDGDACTADYCVVGACVHDGCTSHECCDDGNDCTSDYCYRQYSDGHIVYSECRYGPLTETPCSDDGDPCTNDICVEGECEHPRKCEDGDPCTIDICDPNTGECLGQVNNCPEIAGFDLIGCIGGVCLYIPELCFPPCEPPGLCVFGECIRIEDEEEDAEDEFEPGSIETTILDGLGELTGEQMPVGGFPGAFGQFWLMPTPLRTFARTTEPYLLGAIMHGLAPPYEPSVQGPIRYLRLDVDYMILSGTSVGVGMVIRQNGAYYGSPVQELTAADWIHHTLVLASTNFSLIGTGVSAPPLPNLCLTGGPVEFGLLVTNATITGDPNVIWGLDNYRVGVEVGSWGDFDGDGDLDHNDYGHFQVCISGPAIQQSDPACGDADLDKDGDVDLSDFGLFQSCYGGPGVMVHPNCMN